MGILVGAVLAAGAPSASAATTVGETFTPTFCSVSSGATILQTTSVANSYRVPVAGVLTSWSHQATATPPPALKFKVGRSAGTDMFTIVGDSAAQLITPSVMNTFPVRIPVQPGDVIGFYIDANGDCGLNGPGYVFHAALADQAPGTTATFEATSGAKIDVSAQLEPDADGDGFGDETQDLCPADAAVQAECTFPETKITKGPKPKSAKDKAKFKFKSTEPNSTFQCKLKGKGLDQAVKQYSDCTSPRKYKNLEPGKYKFFVFATDAAGNADATPAKQKFRLEAKG